MTSIIESYWNNRYENGAIYRVHFTEKLDFLYLLIVQNNS